MKTHIIALFAGVSLVTSVFAAAPVSPPVGGTAGGTFSTYFQNLANNPCSGSNVLTGFDATVGINYLKGTCTGIGGILGDFLGSYGDAPSGQAVVGFNPTTGAPNFGSAGWGLTGNAGTTVGTNFIGTTDAQGLSIKTNNAEQVRITSAGNVGIGELNPIGKLEVVGSVTTHEDIPVYFLQDTDDRSAAIYTELSKFYIGTTTLVNSRTITAMPLAIDIATGNTGIGPSGTTDPSAKLRVEGQIMITGGTPGVGKVLMSNATGLGTWTNESWQTQSGSYAKLASPAFLGIPTAPTAATATNTTQIATTAYVKNQGYITAAGETDPQVGANTTNYLSKWNGSALVTSIVSDDGSNVTVGGNVNATGFFYTSDKRLKTHITPLKNSLEKILALSGYSFNWKSNNVADIGVIAQEVETVFPELVKTNSVTGYKAVEYGNLIAPMIEAIKEQDKQIKELKAEVETLKKQLQ